MKFRQKLPAELESFGKKPICFAELAGQEGWIAAYDGSVVVRERVQRSILVQFHETLPSGAVAHAMVRRDGLEELFTQIIIDGNSGPEDEERLEAIERDLRDTVGIPQIS